MNDTMPYVDIIILALIAGFILLRLRNVLGQKPSDDYTKFMRPPKPEETSREPVVQIIEKTLKNKMKEEKDPAAAALSDPTVIAAVKDMKAKDAHFSVTHFLSGAGMAFEMVHEAFSKGDKQGLALLLSEALLKDFSAEIDARTAQEEKTESTLISVPSKEIIRASLIGNTARVDVKFTSEQVIVTRDTKGGIVSGSPSESQHVVDEWSFERDVTAKNPNWKIIET
jgi:predicted lipid-binding transport protein (Tim44 family)